MTTLKVLTISTLLAASLFAQDPGGFDPRRGFRGGPGPEGPAPGAPPEGRRWGGRREAWGGPRVRGFERLGPERAGVAGIGARGMGLGRLLNDPMIRQQVGVTAEQAAKIRQQESDFEKAEIRNRADLQIKRMDLNDLLAADKPDRAAVDAKVQEVGAAQTAVEKSEVDYRLTMRDALTPAQRQKLEQVIAQRRQAAFGPRVPAGGRAGGTAAPAAPQAPGRGRGAAPAVPPQGQPPRQQ